MGKKKETNTEKHLSGDAEDSPPVHTGARQSLGGPLSPGGAASKIPEPTLCTGVFAACNDGNNLGHRYAHNVCLSGHACADKLVIASQDGSSRP